MISAVRPLGHMAFIVVTDHTTSVQAVWIRNSSTVEIDAQSIRVNSFCTLQGNVTDRGDIALSNFSLLSSPHNDIARWPLHSNTNENVALTYRYLSLRDSRLQQRLRLRSQMAHAIRCVLHEMEFLEIETPLLTASSPEGAREFLVPTRKSGQFFALPQSPQQFKVDITLNVPRLGLDDFTKILDLLKKFQYLLSECSSAKKFPAQWYFNVFLHFGYIFQASF
jgi:aspartyl-tRNA synthetase